jgi:hypothetical protein
MRYPAVVVVCLFTCVAACSRSSPTQPGSVSPAGQAGSTAAVSPQTFGLSGGILGASSQKGDTLVGFYTGQTTIGRGGETSQITISLTGGTGQFQSAAGTLRGSGIGSFTGEGKFTLTLQGTISTSHGTRIFRAALHGTSSIACNAGSVIVTLEGNGGASRIGNLSATMTHLVTGAGCS